MVCLGSFVLQCLAFGLHNNFGVFFNVLLDNYGKSNAVTGNVFIYISCLWIPLDPLIPVFTLSDGAV